MGAVRYVVSMNARPWKVSQLCFEVGGILDQINAQLGATVTAFPFATFYGGLNATASGDPSLLLFNAEGILSAPSITASLLANLRAQSRRAVLDKAVNARQNAFYARNSPANIAAIASTANNLYGGGSAPVPAPPSVTNPQTKPQWLQELAYLAGQQASVLEAAYTADGRTGVVKTTNSSLSSTTVTTDYSSSQGSSTSTTTPDLTTTTTGTSDQEQIGAPNFTGVNIGGSGGTGIASWPIPPAGGAPFNVSISGGNEDQSSVTESSSGETATETGSSTATESGGQSSTGNAYATETETIVNTDYGYRVPYIESQAQNARAQISLMDQQFAQFASTLNLPNITTVLQNQSASMDLSVYQLQIAFLNTLLLSPIAGTVTGVYKNPGDAVRAGEPVIRVEDNSTIFLLATVVYRGPIAIAPPGVPPPPNSSVTITTNLFDAGGPLATVNGTVVAARNRCEDDQWDLVVQCTNPLDASGNAIFPIGYHFDYDNTSMTIT